MSDSVARVEKALKAARVKVETREMPASTRTAAEAAAAIGCEVDQIAKSIIFACAQSGDFVLFITAGGNQVDPVKGATMVGEELERADADEVREVTGFAIGGVAPVGHLDPIRAWFDPHLLLYPTVWAAAGTPRHVFPIEPMVLCQIANAQVFDFTK